MEGNFIYFHQNEKIYIISKSLFKIIKSSSTSTTWSEQILVLTKKCKLMLLKNGINPKISCEVVSVIDYSLGLNVKEGMYNLGECGAG